MKNTFVLSSLICAGLIATACATTERPVLRTPETTVEVMREAYAADDASLFLHTLSRPVLDEYSEHTIRIGWSEIRPLVGEFIESAQVLSVDDYQAAKPDPLAPAEFVWPREGAELKKVRLIVDGDAENLLFEREIDPPAERSRQARGFWIGDRYYVRTEHDSPNTYLVEDSPKAERTHWRLVFPYEPFQRDGALTRRMQQRLAEEN